MFTHENILALHSNPLGAMCHHFFRCVAARALIAAPNLMEGAAIFFTAARECLRSGVHPRRGEKTYRPDFIEAGCMGGRRVCAWGQARPLNRGYAVFFRRIGATARSVPSCCAAVSTAGVSSRSEERRVGKECRSRWSPYD